jgi:hypothetical protein
MKAQLRSKRWWIPALLILAAPVILVVLVLYGVMSLALHALIWVWWCPRGRNVLLVYSENAVWRDYIEFRWLPHLRNRAILLNLSQRRGWRPSLRWIAFRHFGGNREFNPMAAVFRPLRPTRVFRFWKPFRDFKRGRIEPVRALEREFFDFARCPHWM